METALGIFAFVLSLSVAIALPLLARHRRRKIVDTSAQQKERDDQEKEAIASTDREIRRYDCDVAACQRRHCVPLARWMNAVEASDLLFVSAQFGADEHGMLAKSPEQQCDAAFRNIERALSSAGRTKADLVKLDVFLVHGRCSMSDYRAAEAKFLQKDNLPAVTVLFVPVRNSELSWEKY